MSRLLYIEGSPSKRRSHTIDAARAFLSSYQQNHPGHHVETLDLWHAELPPFDFDVEFLNGGGLQGQGFRLDIEGDDIDDDALA
jgi:FMN-dependent NADH-azoreductase